METVVEKDGRVRLSVRVQPKASRNAMDMKPDGRLRVALTAPPVDGAANAALQDFVAKTFGLPRRSVRLVHGERSRDKTLELEGISIRVIQTRIEGLQEKRPIS